MLVVHHSSLHQFYNLQKVFSGWASVSLFDNEGFVLNNLSHDKDCYYRSQANPGLRR